MIPLVISHDIGGLVLERVIEVEHLRQSGQPVVIDGLCASACTLYLSLPREQVCATERATLAFHAASDDAGTRILWSYYPQPFRDWLMARGGLVYRVTYMGPHDVANLVQRCKGSSAAATE